MRISFFLPCEIDLRRLEAFVPDRDVAEFCSGQRSWILQTYLRLRATGVACELVDHVPADGLVLFHSKHERFVRRGAPRGGLQTLVGVRADNRQALAAEFEIVQNRRFANGVDRHYVPHWPQPGLVARDRARGRRLERVAYKGLEENLDRTFLGERWSAFLASRGMRWIVDSPASGNPATNADPHPWADYSSVDVILAVRQRAKKVQYSKPATKLVNAWLAGVPALLGAEHAYTELRRAELDYLQVSSIEDAEEAIDRLRSDGGLYEAMIRHGRQRAVECDVPAVTRSWIELLESVLPRLTSDSSHSRRRRRWVPITLLRTARLLARWKAGLPAR